MLVGLLSGTSCVLQPALDERLDGALTMPLRVFLLKCGNTAMLQKPSSIGDSFGGQLESSGGQEEMLGALVNQRKRLLEEYAELGRVGASEPLALMFYGLIGFQLAAMELSSVKKQLWCLCSRLDLWTLW
jgi:hypothetical protein